MRRAPEARAESARGRVEHQVPYGSEAPGGRLPGTGVIDQPAARDARTRHAQQRVDQRLHRTRQHARIGVEEAQHLAARHRRAAVGAAREAEVPPRLDDANPRLAGTGVGGAAVGGVVVDQHDVAPGEPVGRQALEAAVERGAGVPVDDDDRHRHDEARARGRPPAPLADAVAACT